MKVIASIGNSLLPLWLLLFLSRGIALSNHPQLQSEEEGEIAGGGENISLALFEDLCLKFQNTQSVKLIFLSIIPYTNDLQTTYAQKVNIYKCIKHL